MQKGRSNKRHKVARPHRALTDAARAVGTQMIGPVRSAWERRSVNDDHLCTHSVQNLEFRLDSGQRGRLAGSKVGAAADEDLLLRQVG